jgi:hypothetical protein
MVAKVLSGDLAELLTSQFTSLHDKLAEFVCEDLDCKVPTAAHIASLLQF